MESMTNGLSHIQKAMNKEESSDIDQINAQTEDSSELKNMDKKIIEKNQENEVMQTPDEDPGLEIIQRDRLVTVSSWADEMDRLTPLTHTAPTPTPVKPPASRLTLKNTNLTRSQEGHLHDDRNSHMTLQPSKDHSVTAGPRDKRPINNIAESSNIENWTMRATQNLQAISSKKIYTKSKKMKKTKLLENSKNQAESGSFLRRSISATKAKQEAENNAGFLEKENDESIELSLIHI